MTEAASRAPKLIQQLTPVRLADLSDDRLGVIANINPTALLLVGLAPAALLLAGKAMFGDLVSLEQAVLAWWLTPVVFALLLQEPWNRTTAAISALVLLALTIGLAVMPPEGSVWLTWTGPVLCASVLLGVWRTDGLSLSAILFMVHVASWLILPPAYLLAGPVLYAIALLSVRHEARKLRGLRTAAGAQAPASSEPATDRGA